MRIACVSSVCRVRVVRQGKQYNDSPLLVVRKEADLSLRSGRSAPYPLSPKASLGPNGQGSCDRSYQSPDTSYPAMPGCTLLG
jgi:hypothetical protein